jgi:hypothetical protein
MARFGDWKKRSIIAVTALVLIAALAVVYGRWTRPAVDPVIDLLGQLPPEAATVLYADLGALRQSPFLSALYKWAPQPQLDADYTQFVQATGFNYERDLNRIGAALRPSGAATTAISAIAEGRFDKKKITAYALQTGKRLSENGREVFSIPLSGGREISFTFLRDDRIAVVNSSANEFGAFSPAISSDAQDWRERFLRLAGSPIFAVVRQNAPSSLALPEQGPGGIQSPELSALLKQLQWITIAGRPDAGNMRVVLEGEGSPQLNTLQISDLVNGLLTFAQAGLNEPKMRSQLQPQVREAYLEVLKSADVSRIDRGETKSVRLVFEVSPNFLEAVRPPAPGEAGPLLQKIYPKKGRIRNQSSRTGSPCLKEKAPHSRGT